MPEQFEFERQKRSRLLLKPDEIGKVDLVVPTKNSLPNYFFSNLKRIPLNRLIISKTKPLSKARVELFNKVTTPFFVSLDSDVVVGKNWWNEITSYMDKDVGVVGGREQLKGFGHTWDKALNKERDSFGTLDLKKGMRGNTNNCFIRTEAVKDWRPSRPDLSSWEDYDLTQHVLNKGYRWIEPNAQCITYGWTWSKVPEHALWDSQGIKRLRPRSYNLPARMSKIVFYPVVSIVGIILSENRTYKLRVVVLNSYVNIWIALGLIFK